MNGQIDELLSRWEASGGKASAAELCADCPELLEAVNERIGGLIAIGARFSGGTSLVPAPAPPKLDGYQFLELLGAGGMGIVWEAVQLSTGRNVAVKLLTGWMSLDPQARLRFDREVKLAARLTHGNIVRIYDSGLHHGNYYYVMELIAGQPLDEFVLQHKLDRRQIIQLMISVCRAVGFAHKHEVIHRDLKPPNILVTEDGEPHVLDFGLAKDVAGSPANLLISVEGELSGTPAYMAPEQASGKVSQHDPRTDVYSLGAILYRLLTGEYPHDPKLPTLELYRRITQETPRSPREIDPSLPSAVEVLVMGALSIDPTKRPTDANALADGLAGCLPRQSTQPPAPTPPEMKPAPSNLPPAARDAQPVPRAPASRMPMWIAATVAGVLAIVLGVTLVMRHGGSKGGPDVPLAATGSEKTEATPKAAEDRPPAGNHEITQQPSQDKPPNKSDGQPAPAKADILPAAAEKAAPPPQLVTGDKKSGPVVMVAAFENLSPVRAMITYEAGTSNDERAPKRSFRVDRYSEAPRSILEDVFVNAGMKVVERQRVDSMLQESEFGTKSGLVDSNTAVRVGKLLGANVIVMGTVTDVSTETRKFTGYGIATERVIAKCSVRIRAIDITTGRVMASKQFAGEASFDKSSFGRTEKSDVAYDVIKAALDNVSADAEFIAAIKNGGGAH